MSNKPTAKLLSIDTIIHSACIKEIVFTALVLLCFIGDVIGEVFTHSAIMYWLLMVPIFFLGTRIIDKSQVSGNKKTSEKKLHFSLMTWSSAFVSVLLILLLWHAGAFEAETVGLIIHIILAHTLFVHGAMLGFRFYLIGVFLFITSGFTIAMEGVVAVTLMLAIPLTIVALQIKKYRNYSSHSAKVRLTYKAFKP